MHAKGGPPRGGARSNHEGLRATKQDIQELKQELKQEFRAVVDVLTELVRQVETNLLTSFHGYAKGQSACMHALEAGGSAVSERLAALEERVLNLETRRH